MTRKRIFTLIAGLAVLAIVSAACGGDGAGKASETSTPAAKLTSDTGAAALRQVLTSGLQQHEYLAGVALYAAVNTGLDSKVTKAAVATLDQNSVDISKAIGSVYGDGAENAFLPLWRKHIGFFVDYTAAGVKKDDRAQSKARRDLDAYRADFGAFLASANPNLTKQAVADALVPHVASTFDAIDSVVAKKADAFDKLKAASAKLPELANTIAGAIVKQFPQKFDGDTSSGGAVLRQTLTSGLQEHEYLAGIAIFNAVNFGVGNALTKAAIATLDQNSVDISKAIGSVYGDGAEKAFLPLWRKHIGFFVDYTLAGAKDDAAAQEKAKRDLDGYRADFGAFLASANPNLTKQAIADALAPHVESTFDAIDAVLAGSSDQFAKLKESADMLPDLANTLAGAIVKQFPQKFV